jgi:GST-like protein
MIELFYYPTPNTWKVSIMLEECGLPYRLRFVDITSGAQHDPAFLEVSPNGRVPAIVDQEAVGGAQPVFESGAILLYLAEKTGRLLAPGGPDRVAALEWQMWQMAGLGPMAGQAHHFARAAPPGNDYALGRYRNEAARLYGVLDRRLAGRPWIAGETYSIADIACWGWVWFHRLHGIDLEKFPEIRRWFLTMAERPAVQRGRQAGTDLVNAEHRRMLTGPWYQAPDETGAGEGPS